MNRPQLKPNRYEFQVRDNQVICSTTWAGETVAGIAKCDSEVDTFDVDYGRRLAQARVDAKIAKKRVKRAEARLQETDKVFNLFKHYLCNAGIFLEFAKQEAKLTQKALADIRAEADW